MAEVKVNRTKKKQLGQFMTPIDKCQKILSTYTFTINDKVLEPSFGCGNFIITLIDKFIDLYEGTIEERIEKILNNNIYGVEFDEEQYEECLKNIKYKYGFLPENHNLVLSDYFLYEPSIEFDYIIGNPPFGGTIDPIYQDILDKKYPTIFHYSWISKDYTESIINYIDISTNRPGWQKRFIVVGFEDICTDHDTKIKSLYYTKIESVSGNFYIHNLYKHYLNRK